MWRLLGTGISEMTFRKLAKQYGNIYSLRGGGYHIIVLSGYQAVKEGLIDHSEAFVDRPITPFILTATRKRGIFFSNGHTWKQQRRFGVVTMRKLGLGKKGMESQIQEEAQQLVEFFAEIKGQPFDPSLPIMKSVCNVICAAAFGHLFSVEDKDFLELMKAIQMILEFLGTFYYLFYAGFPCIMKHLPGPHQAALSAGNSVVSFAKKEIKQHKENQNLHEPQDFIDFYLFQMDKSTDDPNSTYDEDNLAQCIADLFVAGTDTTSASLQWALLLMANHLEIQDKVYMELEEVFGSCHSIYYEDRKRMPYTNAVIHKIMRRQILPARESAEKIISERPRSMMVACVQLLAKSCGPEGKGRDCQVMHALLTSRVDYCNALYMGLPLENIRKLQMGATIIPDLRSVLLDPEHWETPEEFNPNHFLDKEGHFVLKEAFLPFGAGARSCLGELLAKIEFFNIFTSLLRQFRLEPPEGVEKLSEESVIGLTVHPSPYKICALPRIKTP
ncbi:cytochrome P450 2J5-like [Liasis olivaceus]